MQCVCVRERKRKREIDYLEKRKYAEYKENFVLYILQEISGIMLLCGRIKVGSAMVLKTYAHVIHPHGFCKSVRQRSRGV